MITIDKINANVIACVQKVYPEIAFTAQEKLEEIARPAFKLILDEIKSERYTIGSVKRTFPVELVYFAKDKQRPKLECLEVYEALEPTLFSLCDNLSANVDSEDAVLIIDFELTEIGDFGGSGIGFDEGSGEDMKYLDYTEDLN